jgi:divalent metal cation (Fe/Co/Zn/Cd) transporter
MKLLESGGVIVKQTEVVIDMQDSSQLVSRVIFLAWVTVIYNLIEGLGSIFFGVSDESVSLAGFGVQSLIELASAMLVLWRFRTERENQPKTGLERERRATLLIGVLFLGIAIVIVGASLRQLFKGVGPQTTFPGTIIAMISSGIMFYLWKKKRYLGQLLKSPTILSDASCALACLKISMILLVGSLIFLVDPSLWWIDSVAAIILSVLIAKEGWETIQASQSEEFDGSCGCAHE